MRDLTRRRVDAEKHFVFKSPKVDVIGVRSAPATEIEIEHCESFFMNGSLI